MSSIDAMGPGTPTPMALVPRPEGTGQPLEYKAKAGRIQADSVKGLKGQNVAASFQPRPPVRSPGASGLGAKGSFVDSKA